MARINKSEKGHASAAIGDQSCLSADRASGVQRPILRLTEVRPMTTAQQQRFDMLFDALIAHWVARNDHKGGETHD
jgi:hypothetical protein